MASKDKMIRTLKGLVTRDVRRFKKEGYDLDLTYITDRLIALGMTTDETIALWKNSSLEVWEFLETHHSGHYKIFSLNSKPSTYEKLSENTMWFGWIAGQAPPVDLLFRMLFAVDQWLRSNERNVAVFYSRGGKGRAGVAVAGYLVYSGAMRTADEAISYYGSMRSPEGIGISIPSQRRYVKYVAQTRAAPVPTRKMLRRIVLRPVPAALGTITPIVKLYDPRGFEPSKEMYKTPVDQRRNFLPTDPQAIIDVNMEVEGDVLIKLYDKTTLVFVPTSILMFQFQFHTSFVSDNLLMLTRDELDFIDVKRFPHSFSIQLEFADSMGLYPPPVYQPYGMPAYVPPPVDRQTKPPQVPPQQQVAPFQQQVAPFQPQAVSMTSQPTVYAVSEQVTVPYTPQVVPAPQPVPALTDATAKVNAATTKLVEASKTADTQQQMGTMQQYQQVPVQQPPFYERK